MAAMIAGEMNGSSDTPDLDALVTDGRGGAVLRIRVRLRTSRRGVLGVSRGELVLGVGAPPEKGRATAEALRSLAGWLDLAPSRLSVVSGAAARSKRVLVTGERASALRGRVR